MSIEELLKENTAAMNRLADALENQNAPVITGKAATDKKPDNKKPVKETPAEEELDDDLTGEEESESEVTLQDLQAAMKKFIAARGKDDAKKLLKKYKAAKLPDLDEEQYEEVLRAINKELGEEE